MNYLAHAFLSNNNRDLLIGNFIADHVRGNHFENLPPEIVEGIRLHRCIDSFTDAHPNFKASKRFFYKGFEKYSGVLVDIYFDYFLAKNFEKHSGILLPAFSENVYKVYIGCEHLLPQSSSRFLNYVVKNNIYTAYGSTYGIQQVLFHLSNRINHRVQLDESVILLKTNETALEENFNRFFEDVVLEFLK